MSKIIYDVIQRFEVENGVPRLISTNIQVIEGGEDLLSLATSLLDKLGFYDKFEEKRTSQYIGYKLKNPGKGAKRYQLILSQRQDSLCISIPKTLLKQHILYINIPDGRNEAVDLGEDPTGKYFNDLAITSKFIWVRPGRTFAFRQLVNHYKISIDTLPQQDPEVDDEDEEFSFDLMSYIDVTYQGSNLYNFEKIISKYNIALYVDEDRLFPYTGQLSVVSHEILEELLTYFVKYMMMMEKINEH
ncbi:MAG TPA: hypothetical protein VE944_11855 [Nostoc sp.]|uniref:hypothetical protein n=1 Tax=Nostoc sp. TaxID=1180 RepID=UPI002D39DE5F|nr:hypothetical protein [Nostoc sp.]HYX15036.1 hypothetical protein [Nostoc sp.]